MARPLGVIGNTGSGKSYSVASLIQCSCSILPDKGALAKFIILDINGEYSAAFRQKDDVSKPLNRVYINGEPFSLPLWVFNLTEMVEFFEASQASQVPVLERVITSIREESLDTGVGKALRQLVRELDQCLDCFVSLSSYANELNGTYVSRNAKATLERLQENMKGIANCSIPDLVIREELKYFNDAVHRLASGLSEDGGYSCLTPKAVSEIDKAIDTYVPELEKLRQNAVTLGGLKDITADSPIAFDAHGLQRDDLFHIAVSRFRGQERIQEYIATLRLRIHRQLSDKRWNVFTSPSSTMDFLSIVSKICGAPEERVVIIDCSMLSYDVLPFFCGVIGRLILELRGHAAANERNQQPFVLVLEEAHNYLKPRREDETRGVRLSREAFERIAKEGRKFGLSLIIASQRPSDVSVTVLSQCANFLVHRIQNPEDIDYFRKILPSGSRELLDQLPILAPGDGLLIGSAFNVPARVKISKPKPTPSSETPKPWKAWQKDQPRFDILKASQSWAVEATVAPEGSGDDIEK